MFTRQTSIDCYNEIKANGLLSKRRLQAYQCMLNLSPCTAGELEKEFNEKYGLRGVWKLLSQLRDMGVVKEVGERDCRITKRNVIEWDLTDNLPKNIKLSKNVKQQSKENTLNYLRDLYKKVNTKSFDEDWVKLADLIKKI
tara:strand:- start:1891 stop:2313 length:423 start_codon:yes stop_codon:yes gene_type:complete